MLTSLVLAPQRSYCNNMPPLVQGPGLDCSQDPNNSACQPPAAGNIPSRHPCPDGSMPDSSGNCPTTPSNNKASSSSQQQTCPDGSQPNASGNCLTSQQPPTRTKAGRTVDLSDPDVATPIFTEPKDLSDITKLTFKLMMMGCCRSFNLPIAYI